MSAMTYAHNDSEFVEWFVHHGNTGDLKKALESIENDVDFARVADRITASIGDTSIDTGPKGWSVPGDMGGNTMPYSGTTRNENVMWARMGPAADKNKKLEILDEESRRRGMSG
jgi:hypothetical protein